MRLGKGRGPEGGDNVQRAGARKPPRLMATEGPNAPGDRDGRSPMALQANAVRGCPCEAVAEVGDSHGEEEQACLAAGLTPSVAPPSTSAHQTRGLYSQDEGTSEGAPAPSQCPAGERLTCRFAPVDLGRPIR